MASSSSNNISSVEQGSEGNKTASDDEDEEGIDLGASALPQVRFSDSKHEFEMINLDADEENEDDLNDGYHISDEKRKKRYRKKKKKKENITDSSSDDESNSGKNIPDETNPLWSALILDENSSVMFWTLKGRGVKFQQNLLKLHTELNEEQIKTSVAEYLGEKLAHFFGITSPKYQYVIDEYYRLKELEKEEEKSEKREREYVEKMEAERIAKLEGGGGSDKLTMPEGAVSDITLPWDGKDVPGNT